MKTLVLGRVIQTFDQTITDFMDAIRKQTYRGSNQGESSQSMTL